jgi:hypothetical protein
MSKLTASYLAGYIDGEGYLGIIPNSHKPSYRAVLKVASVNEEIIDWLKESYGGNIWKRKFHDNSKDAYTWDLSGKNLLPFLEKIKPYLKIKNKQAELLIRKEKIKSEKQKYNKGSIDGIVYPQKIKDEIDSLYKKIRMLNQRGKSLHPERLSEKASKEDAIV